MPSVKLAYFPSLCHALSYSYHLSVNFITFRGCHGWERQQEENKQKLQEKCEEEKKKKSGDKKKLDGKSGGGAKSGAGAKSGSAEKKEEVRKRKLEKETVKKPSWQG